MLSIIYTNTPLSGPRAPRAQCSISMWYLPNFSRDWPFARPLLSHTSDSVAVQSDEPGAQTLCAPSTSRLWVKKLPHHPSGINYEGSTKGEVLERREYERPQRLRVLSHELLLNHGLMWHNMAYSNSRPEICCRHEIPLRCIRGSGRVAEMM